MPGKIEIQKKDSGHYEVKLISARGRLLLLGKEFRDYDQAFNAARKIQDAAINLNRYAIEKTPNGHQIIFPGDSWDSQHFIGGSCKLKHECRKEILRISRASVAASIYRISKANEIETTECVEKLLTSKSEVLRRLRSIRWHLRNCDAYLLWAEEKDYYVIDNFYENYLCKTVGFSWRPIYEGKKERSQFDRRAEMFSGFPWTSDSCPWPIGDKEQPLLPVLQIDIGLAGKRIGQDIGTGILQLWVTPDQNEEDAKIRIIPYQILLDEDPHEKYLAEGMEESEYIWQGSDGNIGAQVIDWVKSVVMTDYLELSWLSEVVDVCEGLGERFYSNFDFYYSSTESMGTIQFGVPSPVQQGYSEEYKQGWRSLLQLAGDTGFLHGDGGKGHVYYRLKNVKVEYKYAWSCY